MPKRRRARRAPLSRERVLLAAIALADEAGIEALSMRKIAEEFGVEAMSLYNHVANKDEILDGIADLVVSEIRLPSTGVDWKTAMRERAISAREVLLRHPWAPALLESRTSVSPVRLRYFNSVLRTLREGGFSMALAHNAFLTLDSYIYGFTLHEVSWPFEAEERAAAVEHFRPLVAESEYPYVLEVMGYVVEASARNGAKGFAVEFEFGLDLILDGLERSLRSS